MTAKEFYEKNKGLYFKYNGETVRVEKGNALSQ